MRSWTRQSGFPLLTVRRDYNTGEIILTQDRYFNNAQHHGSSDTLWWIPYNFITSRTPSKNAIKTIADYWLSNKTAIISEAEFHHWDSNDWIFFNKNATGYYRIIYDAHNYELLANALKNGQAYSIDSCGRSQLIDDAFSYAQNGRLTYEFILNLIQFMKNETAYAPWMVVKKFLSFLDPKLAGTDHYNLFEVYSFFKFIVLFFFVLFLYAFANCRNIKEIYWKNYTKQLALQIKTMNHI